MTSCPVCAGALAGGELLLVCGACKEKLGGTIRMTGEFRVPAEFLDGHSDSGPMPRSMHGCNWCGRPADQVKKLLGTADVAICNECVALCADILHAELGDDWRG